MAADNQPDGLAAAAGASGIFLRELHGVIQVAMGWEGIHLYQFRLRAARYGSFELSASGLRSLCKTSGKRHCQMALDLFTEDIGYSP